MNLPVILPVRSNLIPTRRLLIAHWKSNLLCYDTCVLSLLLFVHKDVPPTLERGLCEGLWDQACILFVFLPSYPSPLLPKGWPGSWCGLIEC